MSRIRMWSLTSALLVFAVFAAACGDSSEKSGTSASSKPPGSTVSTVSAEDRAEFDKQVKEVKAETATRFVGKVEGTDAFIGIRKRADAVTAYVCDSKELAVWMDGKVSGDAVTAAKGQASLTGTLASGGKQITGSVRLPDATTHTFSADLAASPAGLYEAFAPDDGGTIRAGWVVLASGEQRGNAKTGTIVRPVSQLSESTLTAALGRLQVPVIPPPGPVTNALSCDQLVYLWSQLHVSLVEQTGNGQDTTDVVNALNEISQQYNVQCIGSSRTR